MFAVSKSLILLRIEYGLDVKTIITAKCVSIFYVIINGSEFGSGPLTRNKNEHPFERLLLEMDIKHRSPNLIDSVYKPYPPAHKQMEK